MLGKRALLAGLTTRCPSMYGSGRETYQQVHHIGGEEGCHLLASDCSKRWCQSQHTAGEIVERQPVFTEVITNAKGNSVDAHRCPQSLAPSTGRPHSSR